MYHCMQYTVYKGMTVSNASVLLDKLGYIHGMVSYVVARRSKVCMV